MSGRDPPPPDSPRSPGEDEPASSYPPATPRKLSIRNLPSDVDTPTPQHTPETPETTTSDRSYTTPRPPQTPLLALAGLSPLRQTHTPASGTVESTPSSTAMSRQTSDDEKIPSTTGDVGSDNEGVGLIINSILLTIDRIENVREQSTWMMSRKYISDPLADPSVSDFLFPRDAPMTPDQAVSAIGLLPTTYADALATARTLDRHLITNALRLDLGTPRSAPQLPARTPVQREDAGIELDFARRDLQRSPAMLRRRSDPGRRVILQPDDPHFELSRYVRRHNGADILRSDVFRRVVGDMNAGRAQIERAMQQLNLDSRPIPTSRSVIPSRFASRYEMRSWLERQRRARPDPPDVASWLVSNVTLPNLQTRPDPRPGTGPSTSLARRRAASLSDLASKPNDPPVVLKMSRPAYGSAPSSPTGGALWSDAGRISPSGSTISIPSLPVVPSAAWPTPPRPGPPRRTQSASETGSQLATFTFQGRGERVPFIRPLMVIPADVNVERRGSVEMSRNISLPVLPNPSPGPFLRRPSVVQGTTPELNPGLLLGRAGQSSEPSTTSQPQDLAFQPNEPLVSPPPERSNTNTDTASEQAGDVEETISDTESTDSSSKRKRTESTPNVHDAQTSAGSPRRVSEEAKGKTPDVKRVRFLIEPTPGADPSGVGHTPSSGELQTPATDNDSDEDDECEGIEAEIDQLEEEQLQIIRAEDRGEDVTEWQRGWNLRLANANRRLREFFGDTPDQPVARALFQTPPVGHTLQRDASPVSVSGSGPPAYFTTPTTRTATTSPQSASLESRLQTISEDEPVRATGLGIYLQPTFSTSQESLTSSISEASFGDVAPPSRQPSPQPTITPEVAIQPPAPAHRSGHGKGVTVQCGAFVDLTDDDYDPNPYANAPSPVRPAEWILDDGGAGPQLTLTEATPIEPDSPQVPDAFAVPDFPPGHRQAAAIDKNALDDRLGNPALGGGWRRRASWAHGTGSFKQANAEAGLLPSLIGPQVHVGAEDEEALDSIAPLPPVRPIRPPFRRAGFTLPDFNQQMRRGAFGSLPSRTTISVSDAIWPEGPAKTGQHGTEISRSFLAELARSAVMRNQPPGYEEPTDHGTGEQGISMRPQGSRIAPHDTLGNHRMSSPSPLGSSPAPGSVAELVDGNDHADNEYAGEGAGEDGSQVDVVEVIFHDEEEDQEEDQAEAELVPSSEIIDGPLTDDAAIGSDVEDTLEEVEVGVGHTLGLARGIDVHMPHFGSPPIGYRVSSSRSTLSEAEVAEQEPIVPVTHPQMRSAPSRIPQAIIDAADRIARDGSGATESSPPQAPSPGSPSSPPGRSSSLPTTAGENQVGLPTSPRPAADRRVTFQRLKDRPRRDRGPVVGLETEAGFAENTGSLTLIDDHPRRWSLFQPRRPAPSPPVTDTTPTSDPHFATIVEQRQAASTYTPPRGGLARMPSLGEMMQRVGSIVPGTGEARRQRERDAVREGQGGTAANDQADAGEGANVAPGNALRLQLRYEQVAEWVAAMIGRIAGRRARRENDGARE